MLAETESTKVARGGEKIIKFLCSYGGMILPRSGDGKLRYVGGLTRVLAVDRSISFAELMVKLGEFCGYSVELRCQPPSGDLETLISIRSDDELAFLIEEYERSCPGSKIRAVLSPPKSLKTMSPPSSTSSSVDFSGITFPYDAVVDCRLCRSWSPPCGSPIVGGGGHRNHSNLRYYPRRGHGSPRFLCREPCCRRNYHYEG